VGEPRPLPPRHPLRAWLCTILRNTFYSDLRKRRREVEDVDDIFASRLSEGPGQEHALALKEFVAALADLPVTQREALVLVGGAGFTHEEAAQVCGCAVGTVKSRVSRARARLSEVLGIGRGADRGAERAEDEGEGEQPSPPARADGSAAATETV